jgi:hypothetical protein
LRPAPATLFDPGVELACELVRRAEFASPPSRFASVFGCETLKDAEAFRTGFGEPDSPIFELTTESEPFRVDMRCLNIRSSILVTEYGAHRYWSQLPTNIDVFPGGQTQVPLWELLLRLRVKLLRQVG